MKTTNSIIFNIGTSGVVTLLLLLYSSFSFSQQIKAKVEPRSDGLQTIAIPEEFRAHIGSDIGLLRLFDQKGKEVGFMPYQGRDKAVSLQELLYDKFSTDSTDIYILENYKKEKKQGYLFRIRNTASYVNYKVEGSDDQKTWFGLLSNGRFDQLYSKEETSVLKNCSFPLTDYRYIRIILDKKSTAPVQVLEIVEEHVFKPRQVVGRNAQETVIGYSEAPQRYDALKGVKVEREEDPTSKSSLFTVQRSGRSPIDYIVFKINSSDRYYRQALVYTTRTEVRKRKQTRTVDYPVAHLTLSNREANRFSLHGLTDSVFYVRIHNEDNAPLDTVDISFLQKPISLLAELKSGEVYTLDADSMRTSPKYDLAKTGIDFRESYPKAVVSGIEQIENQEQPVAKPKATKYILIVCSVVGVAAIFFFAMGLLKDMKKD